MSISIFSGEIIFFLISFHFSDAFPFMFRIKSFYSFFNKDLCLKTLQLAKRWFMVCSRGRSLVGTVGELGPSRTRNLMAHQNKARTNGLLAI
jgi:hypothetical protein